MHGRDKFSVFVVDPNAAIRDALKLLYDAPEVEVSGFEDGASFIDEAAAHAHGCLLVENSLPDSSGLALLSKVRKLRNDIPALLLTSAMNPAHTSLASELGVTGIVFKPFSCQQLINRIQALRDLTVEGAVESSIGGYPLPDTKRSSGALLSWR